MVIVQRHVRRRDQASRSPLQDIPRVQSNDRRSAGSTVLGAETDREGEMRDGAVQCD